MKSKHYKFAALLLVATFIGIVIWSAPSSPPPSINFVEFRTSEYGHRVAVFRVTNDSDQSFSYQGYGLTMPFHSYRVPTAAGWRAERRGFCGTGAGFHELAPHTAVDFEVPPFETSTRFAVGIHFERATPKEIYSRSNNFFANLAYYLVLHWLPEPQPTWSEPVR